MSAQRLSALDTTFLQVEDRVSHMHLGSIGVYEGPYPGRAELERAIEAKLHLVPRDRQRVRFVPLGAARPVWADDPHFSLEYHVRRTALPAPGEPATGRRPPRSRGLRRPSRRARRSWPAR